MNMLSMYGFVCEIKKKDKKSLPVNGRKFLAPPFSYRCMRKKSQVWERTRDRLDSSQTNNFCVHIMSHDLRRKKNVYKPFSVQRCFACFFPHTRIRIPAPFEITQFIGFNGHCKFLGEKKITIITFSVMTTDIIKYILEIVLPRYCYDVAVLKNHHCLYYMYMYVYSAGRYGPEYLHIVLSGETLNNTVVGILLKGHTAE